MSFTPIDDLSPTIELFPYQKTGATFLSFKKYALLADQMGLGKSAQAIRAADLVRASKIIVVCRAIARSNWANEFKKFSLLNREIKVAYDRKTKVSDSENTVTICSYEGLSSVLSDGLHDVFDLAIVDEAHYIKNPQAKRTRELLGKNGLLRKAKRMWLLTGTPAPNHAGELWTTLYTFGATRLPYAEFADRFCKVIQTGYGERIVGTKTDQTSLAQLHQIMDKIILRRTQEDANLELPPIHFSSVVVPTGQVNVHEHRLFSKWLYPRDHTDELAELIKKELGVINGILRQFPEDKPKLSFHLMERLKAEAQSISTIRRYTALQKLQSAAELVRDELTTHQYEKIVIFAIHQDCIEGLRLRLLDFKPRTMYVHTNPMKIPKYIDEFQNPKSKSRVFIANINSAGTSINLTAANQVLFIEQSWTPGDNMQAAARCYRIGQTRPVFVRFLEIADSVDQRVTRLIAQKTADISKIMRDGVVPETILRKKPKSELEDLF